MGGHGSFVSLLVEKIRRGPGRFVGREVFRVSRGGEPELTVTHDCGIGTCNSCWAVGAKYLT